MSAVQDVLSHVRISEVYRALGGPDLRRGRGVAFWRNGDGHNVALNDSKGTWHDFVAAEGGGLLGLVVRVRGGTRADALRWVADFAGVPLQDRPLSAAERATWRADREAFERDLPDAKLWRRTVLMFAERELTRLKTSLFDPNEPTPEPGQIYDLTRYIAHLWAAGDWGAVDAYWRSLDTDALWTAGCVWWARDREVAEARALWAFMEETEGYLGA